MTEKERKIELAYIQNAKKDPKHFGVLYEKYFEQIFIFIFKKIQQEDTTGDICSKTFMKAMMNIEKYEDRGFPFSSWLYRIASNEVNMHFRKQKKEVLVEINENSIIQLASEIEIENKEEQLAQILNGIEELPLEKSQLIELRFFEELSFKEIGGIFDIPEATAKMRVYRILKELKTNITKGKNPS